MTFLEIKEKHRKLKYTSYRCLSNRVDEVITSAEVNANDTVYTEKNATEAEWNRIALSSLELLLGCSKDAKVNAWFRRIGFVW